MLTPRRNHQNSPVRSTITDTHFFGFAGAGWDLTATGLTGPSGFT